MEGGLEGFKGLSGCRRGAGGDAYPAKKHPALVCYLLLRCGPL